MSEDESTEQNDEVEIGDQVDDNCVWASDSQLDPAEHADMAFAAGLNTYSAYISDSPAELVNRRVVIDLPARVEDETPNPAKSLDGNLDHHLERKPTTRRIQFCGLLAGHSPERDISIRAAQTTAVP
jgi:hypothetical protein